MNQLGAVRIGELAAKPLDVDISKARLVELVVLSSQASGIPVVVTWGDASLR